MHECVKSKTRFVEDGGDAIQYEQMERRERGGRGGGCAPERKKQTERCKGEERKKPRLRRLPRRGEECIRAIAPQYNNESDINAYGYRGDGRRGERQSQIGAGAGGKHRASDRQKREKHAPCDGGSDPVDIIRSRTEEHGNRVECEDMPPGYCFFAEHSYTTEVF
jgi:hypothetical protein